jgi:hypothetical protein
MTLWRSSVNERLSSRRSKSIAFERAARYETRPPRVLDFHLKISEIFSKRHRFRPNGLRNHVAA